MRHLRRNSIPAGLLALVAFHLPACSDDEVVGPEQLMEADVVGSYEATTLTVTEDGSTTDVLAEGGSLEITLAADNTTTGSLVTPASLSESGTEEVDDLAGTWSFRASLSGSTVTFSQAADTFVRDSEFQARPGRLETEQTFGTAPSGWCSSASEIERGPALPVGELREGHGQVLIAAGEAPHPSIPAVASDTVVERVQRAVGHQLREHHLTFVNPALPGGGSRQDASGAPRVQMRAASSSS